MRRRLLIRLTGCGVLVVCVLVLASPVVTATPHATLTSVSMADLGLVTQAPVYIGIDRGYFTEEGLEINLVPAKSTPEVVTLLTTGDADFGAAAPDAALFNAMAQGVDIRLLASGGTFLPGTRASGLVVRQDLIDEGAYQGPADLKGRGGVGPRATGYFARREVLGLANNGG